MPEFHTALSVGVEEDLLPLSALLHQRGVAHRIYEEGGRQVLKVGQQNEAGQVAEVYRAWRAGEVRIELSRGAPQTSESTTRAPWRVAPVTLGLIFLSICGFLLFYLPTPLAWTGYFTFTPFDVVDNQLSFSTMDGQYWRLVTPVFLHLGWLHIVFNCLWLWELGAKVEREMNHVNMLLLFLVTAIVSNASQFNFGGPSMFGGMSGVVYGLLGFSWVAPFLQPRWDIQPSAPLMLFMVGWLLACMMGLADVLGFGAIANVAHLGGLLCGALLGAAFGLLSRLGSD